MARKNIFICYRRNDAEGYAGRIYDRLQQRFPDRVFMDVANILPGVDFVEAIRDSLRDCKILVAIIGRHWLTIADMTGRPRIQQPDDYVRLEIARALAGDMEVIPVLVRGASMPSAEQLPPDLQSLAWLNALEITDSDFDHDVKQLTAALGHLIPDPGPANAGATTKEILPKTAPEGDFVFISYERQDDEVFALQLATKIKEHGVNVWVDQWNLALSEDWDRSIDRALKKCARFLIVLSPSSVDSEEVRSELRVALDEKKPIVPVLYKDCDIPRQLRLRQHADFRARSLDDEAEMNELLKALKAHRK